MNALFRLLTPEEYEKLNIDQKMIYLHALAADLDEKATADRAGETIGLLSLFYP